MKQPSDGHKREQHEPDELRNPLPRWYSLLAIGFLVWGTSYFFAQIGGLPGAGDHRTAIQANASAVADGSTVYSANCSSCHQASGAGIPGAFPPLDGSRWVTATQEIPIQILLHGIAGEMVVNEQTYNGVMPSMSHLSDGEIAAVLSYIRTNWSNASSEISADEIEVQRERFEPDRGAWGGGTGLIDTLGVSLD